VPGREKNGEQAIGRSRGGLTTKIHALVDALGNPVELMLTPGQAHDLVCAEPLLESAVKYRRCDAFAPKEIANIVISPPARILHPRLGNPRPIINVSES
jgi:hypothetical protein